jgi:transposase
LLVQPAFDPADYRGRNVFERRFNLLKQRRGLATRYDKLGLQITMILRKDG